MSVPTADPTDPLPLALFDLDDTLSDRADGFATWAGDWIERHHIDDPETALPWLTEADNGGYTNRVKLFTEAAEHFGLDDDPEEMAEDYRRTSHDHYTLDPALIAELESLATSGWRLGIVTNGGAGQNEKIDRIGLRPLMTCCVVSEMVGIRKPDPRIFDLALQLAGDADRSTTWMVGDHPVNDINGAHDAGLSTIWIAHGRDWPNEITPPDYIAATLIDALAHLRALTQRPPHAARDVIP